MKDLNGYPSTRSVYYRYLRVIKRLKSGLNTEADPTSSSSGSFSASCSFPQRLQKQGLSSRSPSRSNRRENEWFKLISNRDFNREKLSKFKCNVELWPILLKGNNWHQYYQWIFHTHRLSLSNSICYHLIL